ncbi:uncharacterized protein METZ01_LOCUS46746 [marine metagenome]|uniref:Uncharacterized protein n=1 Tax=marine metagenome TaxID=408172 RepID=A0A381RPR9_9ZZZZ
MQSQQDTRQDREGGMRQSGPITAQFL